MYCTGCSVIIHHHPQRPPLISQDASCANYDSVQFKIAQLIPPSTICSQSNELTPSNHLRHDAWPPEDGAIFHQMTWPHYFRDMDLRRGSCREQGGVRTLQAV